MNTESPKALDVVEYLKRGGHEAYLVPNANYKHQQQIAESFAPWVAVATMEGKDLAQWYQSEKPQSDLAKLQTENPALHTELVDAKIQKDKLEAQRRKIVHGKGTEEFEKRWARWQEYVGQHPQEQAAAEKYDQFVTQSIHGFRPHDYPLDDS